MNLATLSTTELAAEKAKLEAARVKAASDLRAAAAPIVAEQFRRARLAQLFARLRNNLEPKPAELAYLATLPADEVAQIEKDAAASADVCLAKNPDWRPLRRLRKFDLMTLVRQARKGA